ncbi:MAG: hypothetical protein RIR79_2108 [Pseudomonadota bacterium]|jgi:hypothetical protein
MPIPTPSTSSAPLIDPRFCPLCGQANQCANEIERDTGIPQPPCWCVTATFDPEILARIPLEAQRKACICARCAAKQCVDSVESVESVE